MPKPVTYRRLEGRLFLCNHEFMETVDTGGEEIVSRFNNCINSRDIEGLSGLMTEDHVFMDSSGAMVSGKPACLRAWENFFAAFPDYRNIFEQIAIRDEMIVVTGYSTCSDPRLEGPAIWIAGLSGGFVSTWQVLDDTPDNRAKFRLGS